MHLKILHRVSTTAALAAALLFALQGCQSEKPPEVVKPAPKPASSDHAHDHGDHDHGDGDGHGHHHHHHAEKGPHQGTLVALGDEAAHIELVLDAESGKLTAYVLDGAAAEAVLLSQGEIKLAVSIAAPDAKKGDLPEPQELALLAVNATPEGKASEFAGQSDTLKGAKEFHVVLPEITIGDEKFEPVEFKYPEGNEHHHH